MAKASGKPEKCPRPRPRPGSVTVEMSTEERVKLERLKRERREETGERASLAGILRRLIREAK